MNTAAIQALAGLLLAILGPAGFVGLVVWLVKNAERRQAEITDKFFAHLEKQLEATQKNNTTYVEAIDKLVVANQQHAEANNRLATSLENHTGDLQKIASGVEAVLKFQANDHRVCNLPPGGAVPA